MHTHGDMCPVCVIFWEPCIAQAACWRSLDRLVWRTEEGRYQVRRLRWRGGGPEGCCELRCLRYEGPHMIRNLHAGISSLRRKDIPPYFSSTHFGENGRFVYSSPCNWTCYSASPCGQGFVSSERDWQARQWLTRSPWWWANKLLLSQSKTIYPTNA